MSVWHARTTGMGVAIVTNHAHCASVRATRGSFALLHHQNLLHPRAFVRGRVPGRNLT